MDPAVKYFTTEVKIGKLSISRAGIIGFALYAFIGLTFALTAILTGSKWIYVVSALYLAASPLAAYALNCMIVGKCYRLGTYFALSLPVIVASYIVYIILSVSKFSSKNLNVI